jgi:hypothetical protein
MEKLPLSQRSLLKRFERVLGSGFIFFMRAGRDNKNILLNGGFKLSVFRNSIVYCCACVQYDNFIVLREKLYFV